MRIMLLEAILRWRDYDWKKIWALDEVSAYLEGLLYMFSELKKSSVAVEFILYKSLD